MKEYTRQWIQFIASWIFIIGIVMLGAGLVLNWYNSIPVGYQPNYPVNNEFQQHIPVIIQPNLIPVNITLPDGTVKQFDFANFRRY